METTIRYEVGHLDAECIKDLHDYSCYRCGGPVTPTEGGLVYTMDENHYLEGEPIEQRLLGLLCPICAQHQ